MIFDHLQHEILSVPVVQKRWNDGQGCYEGIRAWLREEGGHAEGRHGGSSWTPDPDIQERINILFSIFIEISISHQKEQEVIDATWQPCGEKKGESHEGMSLNVAANWERHADHKKVMKPIVEAEFLVIQCNMI